MCVTTRVNVLSRGLSLSAAVVLAVFSFVPCLADQSTRKPLEGRVEVEEANADRASLLTGSWKLRIKEFHRHPTLQIDRQDGNNISGTYTGLLGRFPMNGTIDAEAKNVTIHVDFSRSIIARHKKMNSMVAVFSCGIDSTGNVLTGSATIPELGMRTVSVTGQRQAQ